MSLKVAHSSKQLNKENLKILARVLNLVKSQDPLFIVIDPEIINLLADQNFISVQHLDSMQGVTITNRGQVFINSLKK